MSTKIWEAYRIPKSKLTEFTDLLHDAMFNGAVKHINKLIAVIEDDILKKAIEENKVFCCYDVADLKNKKKNRRARFNYIMGRARENASKMERTLFDFDCGFNIWFDKRYAYIIPISAAYDRPKYPEWVEEYSYQNQVYPPTPIEEGKVTQRQYSARGRKWDKLCLGEGKYSHNARRFYHSVVDLTPPNHISSEVELQFAVLGHPKKW